MNKYSSQSHVRWDCKYHVVLVPKYRKKVIFGQLRKEIGSILKELLRQKGVEVIEGHAMPDHIHMCLSIPPKISISSVVGFVKGKSTIVMRRRHLPKWEHVHFRFWSRGYFVTTVGLDEEIVRNYIRNQEKLDKIEDQLAFWPAGKGL